MPSYVIQLHRQVKSDFAYCFNIASSRPLEEHEIERMRLSATTALMSRKDVIIVASVSCIYGLGNPESYGKVVVHLAVGEIFRRNALLRLLIESQYQRNDLELRMSWVAADPVEQGEQGFAFAFEQLHEFAVLMNQATRDPIHPVTGLEAFQHGIQLGLIEG